MPQKLNKAGKMQDYIPAGNGDPSGEYGTSKGTNKNFTTSDKKSKANVITENKSVVVGDKKSNLPSKEELQKIKDKYGVSSDEDALRIIDKWDEWSKSKEGHDKLVKKLEDRIDNYEGVLENVKNGDETGKEVVEDYTRQLRNAREEYKELTGGKEYKSKLDKEKEMDNFRKTRANIIDNDLSGKKNDNLTPTNALKIEKMNEAQLDNEIAKTQREIDRLDSVMKKNTKESEFTKQFPLGVGGSGWSADRKKQFVKNIESETKQAKNYTDAYNEKERLNNRLNALNKVKEQVKGTGKTQDQLKQDAINNTQSTLNWEKVKVDNPYKKYDGKETMNVLKANGYEIRGSGDLYTIHKDGKQIGFTNKLKDAKAYVERRSQANIIK